MAQAKIDLGNTPLHLAALMGNIDTVKILVSQDADINAKNNADATPLILASKGGHYAVMTFLLGPGDAKGADFVKYLDDTFENKEINHQDGLGLTRLHYCAMKCDDKAMKIILDRGAKKDIKDKQDMTALDYLNGRHSQAKMQKGEKERFENNLQPDPARNFRDISFIFRPCKRKFCGATIEKVFEKDHPCFTGIWTDEMGILTGFCGFGSQA